MENKKIYISIIVCAVLAALGGLGYYGYKDYRMKRSNDSGSINNNANTSVDNIKIDIGGGGNVVIKRIDEGSEQNSAIPDLDRSVTVPASFPEDAKNIIISKIKETSAALKKDPKLFGDWLNLAIYRKTIDDYEGARDIWEFLARTNPTDAAAYVNLANLYGYYLKDVKKAEADYLKAIELAPMQVTYYRSAADFYRDVMKDSAKARAIIQKGIDVNPAKSQDLKAILPNY